MYISSHTKHMMRYMAWLYMGQLITCNFDREIGTSLISSQLNIIGNQPNLSRNLYLDQ